MSRDQPVLDMVLCLNEYTELIMMKMKFIEKPTHYGCNVRYLSSNAAACEKEYNKWFPRIPNIASFSLSPPVIDKFMAERGIQKNLPREIQFELLEENDKLNKYIEFQVNRLIRLRDGSREDKSELFFRISRHLVKYSHAFYLASLHHTKPS